MVVSLSLKRNLAHNSQTYTWTRANIHLAVPGLVLHDVRGSGLRGSPALVPPRGRPLLPRDNLLLPLLPLPGRATQQATSQLAYGGTFPLLILQVWVLIALNLDNMLEYDAFHLYNYSTCTRTANGAICSVFKGIEDIHGMGELN